MSEVHKNLLFKRLDGKISYLVAAFESIVSNNLRIKKQKFFFFTKTRC